MSRFVAGMSVVALLLAAPALAQTAPSGSLSGRAFVHFEGQSMTAKDSFDAVAGTTTLMGFGGGLELDRIWKNVFARISLSRMSQDGERVFVDSGVVFPLGLPVQLTLTPIEVSAGWRFRPVGSRGIVPYLGGGALFLKYREKSDSDVSDETVNETYNGFALFGGVEVPVWKKLSAGAELGWRKAKVSAPGGTMRAFGEDDLGGVTFRVMISFRE